MTPHIQRIKHDPENGQYGDCYRTAIACLLDVEPEEVPHFCIPEISDPHDLMSHWLLEYKKCSIFTSVFSGDNTYKEVLQYVEFNNKNIYYLLSARSKIANHIWICINNEIVHDPSGNNITPLGPSINPEGLECYPVSVLVPAQTCLLLP